MELFNGIIKDTLEKLNKYPMKNFDYNENNCWATIDSNQIVLKKDAQFELGGSVLPAVNYSCVTTNDKFEIKDGISLIGKDLNEITEDVSFARIIFLETSDLGEDQEPYNNIKQLDMMKYDSILQDYMMRASTIDKREQVRVSKTAIKNGISFEKVGNAYLKMYKSNPLVKAVHIIFITDNVAEIKELEKFAVKASDITKALNTVLQGMSFDCGSCGLKTICDEVEGMKEMHFKSKN